MNRYKNNDEITNEHKEKILEILYQTESMLQTKEAKQNIASIIDSINYTTDSLVSEVNNYYTNRGFIEKLLVRLNLKGTPERIETFQDQLRYRSLLS